MVDNAGVLLSALDSFALNFPIHKNSLVWLFICFIDIVSICILCTIAVLRLAHYRGQKTQAKSKSRQLKKTQAEKVFQQIYFFLIIYKYKGSHTCFNASLSCSFCTSIQTHLVLFPKASH